MKTFSGKIAFIVGGSSGIGLALAKRLALESTGTIIFSRNRSNLRSAVTEIKKVQTSETVPVSFMQVDASDILQVKKILKKAVSQYGAPDLLFNCAGRALPDYFENINHTQMQETFKLNFFSTWNVISALIPDMKKKGGRIVNISSMAGYLGLFGYTDYCASKFAVIGFSEALRSELNQCGIDISVVCPPDTDTPGFQKENINKPEETMLISGAIKPVLPEYVAREILSGISKNRFLILPGNKVKLSYLIKRLFPSIMNYIINRPLKKKTKIKKIMASGRRARK